MAAIQDESAQRPSLNARGFSYDSTASTLNGTVPTIDLNAVGRQKPRTPNPLRPQSAVGLGAVGSELLSTVANGHDEGEPVWPQSAAAVIGSGPKAQSPVKAVGDERSLSPQHQLNRSNSFNSPVDLHRRAQFARSSPAIAPGEPGVIGKGAVGIAEPVDGLSPLKDRYPTPPTSARRQQQPDDLVSGMRSLAVGSKEMPQQQPQQPPVSYAAHLPQLWSPPGAHAQLPNVGGFAFPSPDTFATQPLPPAMNAYFGQPTPPQPFTMGLGISSPFEAQGGPDYSPASHRSGASWATSPRGSGGRQISSGGHSSSSIGILTTPYDSPYAAAMMSPQSSSMSRRSSGPGAYMDQQFGGQFGHMSPFGAASGLVGMPALSAFGISSSPSNFGLYGPNGINTGSGSLTPPRPVRSAVLEDFRLNRHRRWEIEDLRGHICEFSQDQIGSRHVQQRLDTASVTERQIVFDEIMPNLLQLATDVFANYVCQKLIEVADPSQRGQLCNALEGHVLRLSLQMYGCRVVQKAIERAAPINQRAIVRELDGHVLACARDQNANHVLQRVLERAPAEELGFIPRACEGQVFALATHPYGCRVLQRVRRRARLQGLTRVGNYVIQYILEKGDAHDRAKIINKVRGNLVVLAKHKFASNVIDKVVLCASEAERAALVDEILYDPTAVAVMLRDPYANYPVQKFLLTVPQGPQRDLLLQRTAEALAHLRRFSPNYSKHLVAIERWIVAPAYQSGLQMQPTTV